MKINNQRYIVKKKKQRDNRYKSNMYIKIDFFFQKLYMYFSNDILFPWFVECVKLIVLSDRH